MKRNIVFIPNIELDNRSTPYHYSIKSWKKWCDKNDCDLIEWKDLIFPVEQLKITFQRYWALDLLENSEIEYDQVCVVDADTIIHPDCPNFFLETEHKYCGVLNNGCHEWLNRSIKNWGTALFPNEKSPKPWNYINGGFQIFNKKHKKFIDIVKNFYTENSNTIVQLDKQIKAGTDQTIINYLLTKHDVEVKYLPECYNLQDMFRKSLLHIPGHSWFSDELHYLNSGWIYHFNAIPQNQAGRQVEYWMGRTYKDLYE